MDREKINALRASSPPSGQIIRRLALRDIRQSRNAGELWIRRAGRELIGQGNRPSRGLVHAVASLEKGKPEDIQHGIKELLTLILIEELSPDAIVSFPRTITNLYKVMHFLSSHSTKCDSNTTINLLESILALIATLSSNPAAAKEIISSKVMEQVGDLMFQSNIVLRSKNSKVPPPPEGILIPLLLLIGNTIEGVSTDPSISVILSQPVNQSQDSVLELGLNLALGVCEEWSRVVNGGCTRVEEISLSCIDIALWFIARCIPILDNNKLCDRHNYRKILFKLFRTVFALIHSTNLYISGFSSAAHRFTQNNRIYPNHDNDKYDAMGLNNKKNDSIVDLNSESLVTENVNNMENMGQDNDDNCCVNCDYIKDLSDSNSIQSTFPIQPSQNISSLGLSYRRVGNFSSQMCVSDLTLVDNPTRTIVDPLTVIPNNSHNYEGSNGTGNGLYDTSSNEYGTKQNENKIPKVEGTTIVTIRTEIFNTLTIITSRMKFGSIIITSTQTKGNLPNNTSINSHSKSGGIFNSENNNQIISFQNNILLSGTSPINNNNLEINDNNNNLEPSQKMHISNKNEDSSSEYISTPSLLFGIPNSHQDNVFITVRHISEICNICGCGLATTVPRWATMNTCDDTSICPAVLNFLSEMFKVLIISDNNTNNNDAPMNENDIEQEINYSSNRTNCLENEIKQLRSKSSVRTTLRTLVISYVFPHISSSNSQCILSALNCTNSILKSCGNMYPGDYTEYRDCQTDNQQLKSPGDDSANNNNDVVSLPEILAISGALRKCVELLKMKDKFNKDGQVLNKKLRYNALTLINISLSLATPYFGINKEESEEEEQVSVDMMGSDIVQSTLIDLKLIEQLVNIISSSLFEIPRKVVYLALEILRLLCMYEYDEEQSTSPGIEQLLSIDDSLVTIERISYSDDRNAARVASGILELIGNDEYVS